MRWAGYIPHKRVVLVRKFKRKRTLGNPGTDERIVLEQSCTSLHPRNNTSKI
jgi:hypothetical protein